MKTIRKIIKLLLLTPAILLLTAVYVFALLGTALAIFGNVFIKIARYSYFYANKYERAINKLLNYLLPTKNNFKPSTIA